MVTMLNALVRQVLKSQGWSLERHIAKGIRPDAFITWGGDQRIALEAQFANSARQGTDLCKFMAAHGTQKLIDFCVIVAMERKTAQLCAGNVASSDGFLSNIEMLGAAYSVPTVVLSLSADQAVAYDVRQFGHSPELFRQGKNTLLQDLMARDILTEIGQPTWGLAHVPKPIHESQQLGLF